MKLVTQDEVNKACRSRSLILIDDILVKVKLELMEAETQVSERKPTMSEQYELRVLRLNIDRLNERIVYLGKRTAEAKQKRDEDKAKLEMYTALARAKMPVHSQITKASQSNVAIEDIPEHLLQGKVIKEEPVIEQYLKSIGDKFLNGKPFDEIAKENQEIARSQHMLNELQSTEAQRNQYSNEPIDPSELIEVFRPECRQCGSLLTNEKGSLCKDCAGAKDMPRAVIDTGVPEVPKINSGQFKPKVARNIEEEMKTLKQLRGEV